MILPDGDEPFYELPESIHLHFAVLSCIVGTDSQTTTVNALVQTSIVMPLES